MTFKLTEHNPLIGYNPESKRLLLCTKVEPRVEAVDTRDNKPMEYIDLTMTREQALELLRVLENWDAMEKMFPFTPQ